MCELSIEIGINQLFCELCNFEVREENCVSQVWYILIIKICSNNDYMMNLTQSYTGQVVEWCAICPKCCRQ